MAVRTIWHIRYACGHEADRKLSDLRPSEWAGLARFYADGECPSCWGAKKRAADGRQWPEQKRAERAAWERVAAMPALDGSERAVAWTGQVRHQLLIAAAQLGEHFNGGAGDDEAFDADIERPARQITSASWWIDQPRVGRGGRARTCRRCRCQGSGHYEYGEPVLMGTWLQAGPAWMGTAAGQQWQETVRSVVANLDRYFPDDQQAYLTQADGAPAYSLWLRLVDEQLEELPTRGDGRLAFPWRQAYDRRLAASKAACSGRGPGSVNGQRPPSRFVFPVVHEPVGRGGADG